MFFEAEGHAGYAEYGKDTVCSAVSALMCSAVAEFDELCASGRLCYRARTVTHGYICADVVVRDKRDREAVCALATVTELLKKAFTALEEQYPQNVTAEV